MDARLYIYDDSGDGPDGGVALVFDLNGVELQASETFRITWNDQGWMTVEP